MHDMRTAAPALLLIFRSRLQAAVLAEMFAGGRNGVTAADLARILNEPLASVHRETRRLLAAGLLVGRPVGRALVLSPNESNPLTPALRQLVVVAFGPQPLLARALNGVAGVDAAYIFGTWAARSGGVPGPAPGYIDVIIIGNPRRLDVDVALDGLEAQLRREMNVTLVSAVPWASGDDPFVRNVRANPLLPLVPARSVARESEPPTA